MFTATSDNQTKLAKNKEMDSDGARADQERV